MERESRRFRSSTNSAAISIRRNQLRRVRDAFPEIERPGVYILIGTDDAEPDRLLAYIGKSEGVGARLAYHNANEQGRDAKAFWTDTAVLISKDENLTKSHARYLELPGPSGERKPRWSLPNSNGLPMTLANFLCRTGPRWRSSSIRRGP